MEAERSRAIVLADGDTPDRRDLDTAWPGWDARATLVVAADGGARHASGYGLHVDRWIGDGDSIGASELDELRESGTEITRLDPEKDETDAEAALHLALDAGVDAVVVLGALGGPRIDHALANVGLLGHRRLVGRSAWLFDGRCSRLSLLEAADGSPGSRRLEGRIGDIVSLIPLGETALGVTTSGLRYPLVDEPLAPGTTRGVSNVRTETVAIVMLKGGRLLVVETPVTVDS
jgi:thiamine pyrophosphokinase